MWTTWRAATQEALYGRDGFYARGEHPAAHFATSVHVSSRYAEAILALLRHTDEALGHPDQLDLVDIGAGQGELLDQVLRLAQHLPAATGPAGAWSSFPQRITARAIEIAPRPSGADDRIRWASALPGQIRGLVIASEWLDNIPVDVAELTPDGPRIMLVDPGSGAEQPGPAAGPAEQQWLHQWWPLQHPGERAELGYPRCAAWSGVIGRLAGGMALAADYAHSRARRPLAGTLAAFRDGRAVRPIPDGSRDITAHVALDACAAAGIAAGATQTVLTTQRAALRALGLTGRRPPLSEAERDPAGYLTALRLAAGEAELTDPAGLGGFGWLVQAAGIPLPPALAGLSDGEV
ncbi:MAG TPA: SAM-dependent methyltransferase [Streptosporangiaceae bacterium]|nr:SAM-dependent methyltransferase [Streptosporangiaceae bacterium]